MRLFDAAGNTRSRRAAMVCRFLGSSSLALPVRFAGSCLTHLETVLLYHQLIATKALIQTSTPQSGVPESRRG